VDGGWENNGTMLGWMAGWKDGHKCINAYNLIHNMLGGYEWPHGYPSMWYGLPCYMDFHVV
jgi:hypothetical protein